MTVLYRELVATRDVECDHCGQPIRAGQTYLRCVSTPRRNGTDHWKSFRAHGRYPADCPNAQEGKTA